MQLRNSANIFSYCNSSINGTTVTNQPRRLSQRDRYYKQAQSINLNTASLDGFRDRLDQFLNSDDKEALFKESISVVRLGTSIQHDIAGTLSKINSKDLIESAIKRVQLPKFPIFMRFQPKRVENDEAITVLNDDLAIARVDLRLLAAFTHSVVHNLTPKYNLLLQDALISNVITTDQQRILMLTAAVQTTEMLLLTLNNCSEQIERQLLSIEQLLTITLPAWALSQVQKKLLTVTTKPTKMELIKKLIPPKHDPNENPFQHC